MRAEAAAGLARLTLRGPLPAIAIAVVCLGSACTAAPDTCDASVNCAPLDASVEACPKDLPTTCPSPMPSYSGEVSQIIANRCLQCHDPSGPAASYPLTPWSAVNSRFTDVLDQVYACRMPQDAGLPEAERQALLGWLVCMAPDN